MFDLLDNLRRKPQYVRKQIAVAISSGFLFIVFSMWIGSWGAKNDEPSLQTASAKPPSDVIIDTMKGIKDEGVSKWLDTVTQIQEVSPEGVAGVGAASDTSTDTPPDELVGTSEELQAPEMQSETSPTPPTQSETSPRFEETVETSNS